MSTDLTGRPADLAMKRPARVVDGRTTASKPATRRRTGFRAFAVLVFLLVGFLFAGFLLSLLQQYG